MWFPLQKNALQVEPTDCIEIPRGFATETANVHEDNEAEIGLKPSYEQVWARFLIHLCIS